uniref:HECT-type E3 ubiquitin transferase n=1 Tax=Proboscia inermis TaxID=420281 RepID=A0A7S0C7I7_9STRA
MKTLIKLMFLLSPVRPQKLLLRLVLNFCANAQLRRAFLTTYVALLNGDRNGTIAGVDIVSDESKMHGSGNFSSPNSSLICRGSMRGDMHEKSFPPNMLIGTAPDDAGNDFLHPNMGMFRRKHGNAAAAAIAMNLPTSAKGSSDGSVPLIVSRRIIDALSFLAQKAPRICVEMLLNDEIVKLTPDCHDNKSRGSSLDSLLDLISLPLYSKSATNLEQLLSLIEIIVSPLSMVSKDCEHQVDISKKDIESAASAGKEWLAVPRPDVSQHRLRSLCSVLRLEGCKDSPFQKVNTISKRLCRVESNKAKILSELASVAQGLGIDAIRDLKSLSIHLNQASKLHKAQAKTSSLQRGQKGGNLSDNKNKVSSIPASAVTLSSSSSEIKLLRVLQTLHAVCGCGPDDKKEDGQMSITAELGLLLQRLQLESLWDELAICLKVVSVLEGVSDDEEEEKKGGEIDEDEVDADGTSSKKLQSSVAGLLTRFLPTIEAFFIVTASSAGDVSEENDHKLGSVIDNGMAESSVSDVDDNSTAKYDTGLVGVKRLVTFVAAHKVLLNALLRANPALLDKGLRPMVQIPSCRPFMDFDVKRQWFKTQVRRLRQHANRRAGSLRLNIRRKHVFEDAFHQIRQRNADEMRGRLHITFRNEEGVDAGGLSREFFGILAKEMFNPNYALFTSTEDGCTFQPNPNSSINPEHLSYFRFVGRIVGKAVVDGFLLDAHFTRSLYKHMLGSKPTHHDMEAIDPDYYKNLKMILEYNLADIGLDLTFSTEDHSFGRSQTIDLIPDGRNVHVTEDTKAKYVSLVCQHRMTTAIDRQIKSYLEGFYDLVKPELISIFTAKELELLISGMPDIDMHDLQRNTEYQHYKASDPQIGWFWNIMFSLKKSEKASFLQFVTGSAKVPLGGFAELQGMRGTQKFSIHRAGGSSGALISAHTCFNALDVPVYKSEDEMREKILYAINEGATGFLFA